MTDPIKLPPLPEGVKDSWDKRIGEAMQDYARQAIEAAFASPEVQKQPQYKTLLQVWRSTDSCLEFWSWDVADQYDYDQAKPENRRIIQIIKEG